MRMMVHLQKPRLFPGDGAVLKKVRDEMPMALGDLEREFRSLLGDNSGQGHGASPPTSVG